jgi:hypothetical protein
VSMLLLILSVQVTAALPSIREVPSTLSPEAMTIPAFDLSCRVYDPEGKQYAVGFEQRGGRGFVQRVQGNDRYVNTTEVHFKLVEDKTGKLAGFDWISGPEKSWPRNIMSSRVNGSYVVIETARTRQNNKFVANIRLTGALSIVDYTGFCDMRSIAQMPLTEAESIEARKK